MKAIRIAHRSILATTTSLAIGLARFAISNANAQEVETEYLARIEVTQKVVLVASPVHSNEDLVRVPAGYRDVARRDDIVLDLITGGPWRFSNDVLVSNFPAVLLDARETGRLKADLLSVCTNTSVADIRISHLRARDALTLLLVGEGVTITGESWTTFSVRAQRPLGSLDHRISCVATMCCLFGWPVHVSNATVSIEIDSGRRLARNRRILEWSNRNSRSSDTGIELQETWEICDIGVERSDRSIDIIVASDAGDWSWKLRENVWCGTNFHSISRGKVARRMGGLGMQVAPISD